MGRAELPQLGDYRVVVSLPSVELDDLVAAAEVLWQEGHRVWSVGAGELDVLEPLLRMFGRRARIGVHGIEDAAAASAAVAAGADFLASLFCLPEVVEVADGVPVVLGGMTPQELRAAYQAGASAVQAVPCDAFGTSYARALPELMGAVPLLATGRLEHYQAELWLTSGAVGVWPTGLIDRQLVVNADLSGLRVVAQRWQFRV